MTTWFDAVLDRITYPEPDDPPVPVTAARHLCCAACEVPWVTRTGEHCWCCGQRGEVVV